MAELEKVWLATAGLSLSANIVLLNPEPFAKEGLEVIPVCPGSGVPIVRLMLDGKAEYCNVLALPIAMAAEGAPLKFLASYQNTGWELWCTPGINSLEDLVGKQIGATSPMARKYLDDGLRKHGIDPAEVKGGPHIGLEMEGIMNIKRGKVAGALILPPATAMAEKEGLSCVFKLGEMGDPISYGLMTTDKQLAEKPDQVKRMVRATVNSVAQLLDNPKLALDLVLKQGVTDDYAPRAAEVTLQQLNPNCDLSTKSQQTWIDYAKEYLGFASNPPLSQVFDFSILAEVMKERG